MYRKTRKHESSNIKRKTPSNKALIYIDDIPLEKVEITNTSDGMNLFTMLNIQL